MRRATVTEVVHAAKIVGVLVGADCATYCFGGRLAVPLAGGWALAVSPDDAARIRLEALFDGSVRATMWSLAGDDARLAELASEAIGESAALAA